MFWSILLEKKIKMTESVKAQTEKICRMASDTHYPFVCFATEIDGTHNNDLVDVTVETFSKITNDVLEKHPNASFMLIAAGPKSCAVFVHAENGADWLQSCGISPTSVEKKSFFAVVPFANPMKDKEQISGAAFAYLRKNNLMEEEEETPPFDLNDY